MNDWYVRMMKEASDFNEAKNYAIMAGLTVQDLVRIRYLEER